MTNKLMYFIGNWKMFGHFGSIKIINRIQRFLIKYRKMYKKNKIILCIPSILIRDFTKKTKAKYISIGAQNCHQNEKYGPFTGSINASMIRKSGAKYVILGHSENRLEGETNKIIKAKIQSALKEKLNVIFCIGESYKEKKQNKTFSVLKKQMKGSLLKKYNLNKVIIAYEPVWSIGSGKVLNNKQLKKIFLFIKHQYKKIFKLKNSPIVLYGGSVNSKNIRIFSTISEIDGFLIGGASTSSKKFIDIIKNYYK